METKKFPNHCKCCEKVIKSGTTYLLQSRLLGVCVICQTCYDSYLYAENIKYEGLRTYLRVGLSAF